MFDFEKIYNTPFRFRNKNLTLNEVIEWERLKTYTDSSHFERRLLRNPITNEVFLYEFYEYVDFSYGDDLIYTTYVLVQDETDADRLNEQRDIRRSPYFRVHPNYEMEIG